MDNLKPYIGYSALALSISYRIPQIYKIWVRKSALDISLGMIAIQNVSYGLYILYGFLIEDIVYIASSIISVIQNMIIVLFYYKFMKSIQIVEEK